MNKPTRKQFTLRPHTVSAACASDDRRHAESAQVLLTELEAVCEEVLAQWPLPHGETLRDAQKDHLALYNLVRRRDRLCDSVSIFSALAVEGFLNYYGVVRLGEDVFNAHFERMGLVPKLRALLLVCDGVDLSPKDPLVALLQALAADRNRLAHPKAKEFDGYVPAEERPGVPVPAAGRQAVTRMNDFFAEFLSVVPKAGHLVPVFESAGRGDR